MDQVLVEEAQVPTGCWAGLGLAGHRQGRGDGQGGVDRTGAWWEKLSVSYRAKELQEAVLPTLKLGTAPQPL